MKFEKFRSQMENYFALGALLLTAMMIPVGAGAQTPTAVPSSAHTLNASDLEAWLDGFLPYALSRGNIAGAAISVVKDGRVLLKKGYGYANVAAKRRMDPDLTLTRLGSTSKLFTWTAVMQLVAAGRIDLDADVNQYLDFKLDTSPEHPVTLRELMGHRGGFEEGLKSVLVTDPAKAMSTEQYLKSNLRPIVFVPGTIPAYSNYGTALAGYIVQRVSGMPFEDYIDTHIFAPLGMSRSTFRQPVPAALASEVSQGYRAGTGAPHPFEFVTTAPAGALSATAADMAQFMLAYLQHGRTATGVLLDPATVAAMQAPNPASTPGFSSLTYGFFDEHYNGRRVLGHGGDTILFHTDLFLIPEEGVGIFYSLNSRGAEDSNYAVRDALYHAFMDRYFPAPAQPSTPPALATAAADGAAIAGTYESSRRIQTGFLSFFYLLDQQRITANADGTIDVPDRIAGAAKPFREVEPNVWQDVVGKRRVRLIQRDGQRIVVDGDDPSSVLEAVPPLRSGVWNLPALVMAVTVLVFTLLLWPAGALIRRYYRIPRESASSTLQRAATRRVFAGVGMAYLIGWFFLLRPILSNDLSVYDPTLDPLLRVLQLIGILLMLATAASIWSAVVTIRRPGRVLTKIGAVLLTAALVDLVWIGLMCKFISVGVSY